MMKKLAEKLDGYGGFHDSKVKQIYMETNRRILGIVMEHAYDAVPSSAGEVVIPDKMGGSPKRLSLLYRPMTVLFKDISQVVVKMQPDPINEEIILSCQLVEHEGEEPIGADMAHIEVILTSLSRLDIFCRDLECKPH